VLFCEFKRHLDKPDETYMCDLVARGTDWVVLSYVSNRAWEVAGALLPAGSQTLAFYHTGVAHVLWQMHAPSGNLKGHLFHICRDVQVEERRVSYLDLLLDVWIGSDGVVEILDREDVDMCYREGKLCEADLEAIAAEEKRIVAHWPVLVREMDSLLSDL
jgi:predicted RNA-binding protein associated with RNAse of E/G family